MRLASDWELSSDAELITAVRSGVSDAFGTLYERHVDAARAVARQYSNSAADAEDAVSDAFSRVFSAIQGGGGPDVAFRAYLFTVIRRVALVRVESGRRAQPTDDIETLEAASGEVESTEEPTMAGFERGVVSQAYKSLPERWQAVLWYTEVEELSPAEIAPVLGLTANGVAALAYRAREGLRQAYLQQHLASPTSEACTIVNSKLGAYVRGGLAKRETALVDSHLDECGACRALVLELGDVNHGMRVVIAPLVLGAAALAAVKGLGFGGAAGAVGAAAGAGAGTGAGAGLGSGGAGAAAGGGSLAGAGSGAFGAAASGLVAAGAGAAVLVDAVHSAAPAAGAGSSAGSGASAAGAGAGAAGGAGATGAGLGTGGLAGFLAGLPAVIGVAVAGVVVAAAVGVAGLLGAFSPNDESLPPTLAAAAEPDPTSPADSTDDGAGEDGTDQAQTVDPADPATVPVPPAPPADGTTTPDLTTPDLTTTPTTTSTSPPTSPPPTSPPPTSPPPTSPPPTSPTTPATLEVTAPDGLSLTAGRPEYVELTVHNTGGRPTGEVVTEFLFDAGVDWSVDAVDALPAGHGAARSAASDSGWTCQVVDATTAACTLADLPPAQSRTLIAAIEVTDDVLDGERDLDLGIRTWAPGLGTAPDPIRVSATVASPAAVLAVGAVPDVTLEARTPSSVTIPVTNSGGTTANDVTAVVELPADVSAAATAPWTCTAAEDDTSLLTCTLAGTLARRGAEAGDLTLDLVVDDRLRNQARSGQALSVEVAAANANAAATSTDRIEVRSAPAELTVSLEPVGTVQPGQGAQLAVTVANTGGTDAHDADLRVAVPAPLTAADPLGDSWDGMRETGAWHRQIDVPVDSGTPVGTLSIIAPTTLRNIDVPVEITASIVGTSSVATTVAQARSAPAVLGVAAAWSEEIEDWSEEIEELRAGGDPGTAVVEVTNSGGTDAIGAEVSVTLPAGVVPTDAAGEGWDPCPGARTWCRPVDAPAPGADESAESVSVRLTLEASGDLRDQHGVSATIGVTVHGPGSAGATSSLGVALWSAPASPRAVSTLAPDHLVGDETAPVTVTLTNVGGTTAHGVRLAVTLPAEAEAVQADADWTVGAPAADGSVVYSQSVDVAPGAEITRVLTLGTATVGDVSTSVGVLVEHDGASVLQTAHQVRLVRAAPAALSVSVDPTTSFVPGVPRTVTFTVENTGGTAIEGLTATVTLPPAVSWAGASAGSSWACTGKNGSNGVVTCTLAELRPGEPTALSVELSARGAVGERSIGVLVTGGGLTAEAATSVVVTTQQLCAPPWQVLRHYEKGDVASYESWNYSRSYSGLSLLTPDSGEKYWVPIAECGQD